MTFTDYDKAAELLGNWHHARAMDCLRALSDTGLTDDEHKELSNDYKFHTETEQMLYKATLYSIDHFYSA
jgi:hypothetical protein